MQAKILQILTKKKEPVTEPIKYIEVQEKHENKCPGAVLTLSLLDVIEDLHQKINLTNSYGLPIHKQREIISAMCYLKEKVEALDEYVNNN